MTRLAGSITDYLVLVIHNAHVLYVYQAYVYYCRVHGLCYNLSIVGHYLSEVIYRKQVTSKVLIVSNKLSNSYLCEFPASIRNPAPQCIQNNIISSLNIKEVLLLHRKLTVVEVEGVGALKRKLYEAGALVYDRQGSDSPPTSRPKHVSLVLCYINTLSIYPPRLYKNTDRYYQVHYAYPHHRRQVRPTITSATVANFPHSAINLKLLHKLLAPYNVTLAMTRNGREALDYLINPQNPRPDIFLLDVCIPP